MQKNSYATWMSLLLASTIISPTYAMLGSDKEGLTDFSRYQKITYFPDKNPKQEKDSPENSGKSDSISSDESEEDKEDETDNSSKTSDAPSPEDAQKDQEKSTNTSSNTPPPFASTHSQVAKEQAPDDPLYYNSSYFNNIINELISLHIDNKEKTFVDFLPQWEKLHTIGDSFINNAITYGRVIIKEHNQPESTRTIKPVNVGGIAGGDKYIAQGILFKFARDRNIGNNRWLYGEKTQNDYRAAKSAGQELLSANYVGSHSALIKVPLMAVVDYWGHRLIATALLPIGKNSLVYGSADAGASVFATNAAVSQEMTAIGKTLNLQPHTVTDQQMALCGDIEVHTCSFQKGIQYYCLDTARVFPPEINPRNIQGIFYEKLRPEFVKKNKKPLSSDAFTGFQNKVEGGQCNKNILEATQNLHQNIIPVYIRELTKEETIEDILSTTSLYYTLRWSNRDYVPNALVYDMHKNGINLRHLGKIVTQLETLNPLEANCSREMLGRLKKYAYNVMLTRVIKNHLRQEIQENIKEEQEYREKLLYMMNVLTCKHPESEIFWKKTVPELLKSKFGISRDYVFDELHQGFLLLNFCQLAGIILHPVCFEQFSKQYNVKMSFKFGLSDIIEIKPTIKYLNTIDFATGIYSLGMSDKAKEDDSRVSMDYLQKAHDRLLSAMATWCNFSHPIIPKNFSATMKMIKERILQHKLQTKKSDKVTPISTRTLPGNNLSLLEANQDLPTSYSTIKYSPQHQEKETGKTVSTSTEKRSYRDFSLPKSIQGGKTPDSTIKINQADSEKDIVLTSVFDSRPNEEIAEEPIIYLPLPSVLAKPVLREEKTTISMWDYRRKENLPEALMRDNSEDPTVQLKLGLMYQKGKEVRANPAKAFQLFKSAAAKGNTFAQYYLGLMYNGEQGIISDRKEAQRWFKVAFDGFPSAGDWEGNPSRLYLGIMYKNGYGVKRDFKKALSFLLPLSEEGNALAQEEVGLMCKNGQGVKKDLAAALHFFSLAADISDPARVPSYPAMVQIGLMYKDGHGGLEQDNRKASLWFAQAWEKGTDREAAYQRGLDRLRDNEQKETEDEDLYNPYLGDAFERFHHAKERGHSGAFRMIGMMYHEIQHIEKGRYYIKLAAKQGNADAQRDLGVTYQDEKNYAEALKWLKLAAEQNHSSAERYLGLTYQNGLGVDVDLAETIHWYKKSVAHGDEKAKQLLEDAEKAHGKKNTPEKTLTNIQTLQEEKDKTVKIIVDVQKVQNEKDKSVKTLVDTKKVRGKKEAGKTLAGVEKVQGEKEKTGKIKIPSIFKKS